MKGLAAEIVASLVWKVILGSDPEIGQESERGSIVPALVSPREIIPSFFFESFFPQRAQ